MAQPGPELLAVGGGAELVLFDLVDDGFGRAEEILTGSREVEADRAAVPAGPRDQSTGGEHTDQLVHALRADQTKPRELSRQRATLRNFGERHHPMAAYRRSASRAALGEHLP